MDYYCRNCGSQQLTNVSDCCDIAEPVIAIGIAIDEDRIGYDLTEAATWFGMKTMNELKAKYPNWFNFPNYCCVDCNNILQWTTETGTYYCRHCNFVPDTNLVESYYPTKATDCYCHNIENCQIVTELANELGLTHTAENAFTGPDALAKLANWLDGYYDIKTDNITIKVCDGIVTYIVD